MRVRAGVCVCVMYYASENLHNDKIRRRCLCVRVCVCARALDGLVITMFACFCDEQWGDSKSVCTML